MRLFFVILFLLTSCTDFSNQEIGEEFKEKSLIGSECKSGCIWSTYAVSLGVQSLTHYCDGLGCHCVKQGDIYTSCKDITEHTPRQSVSEEQHVYDMYNSYKGRRIADEAYYEASRRNTIGWCYNAVADAVERITGRFLWGNHAYQSADQFAASNHFFEVWDRNLINLPEGAIVVWGKGTSQSGHVSVSLGNGQEASDHITSQMTYHYGGAPARIFLPK